MVSGFSITFVTVYHQKGLLDCRDSDCHGTGMGACSSDWVFGLVSDMVLIPKDLAPGDYVLSWR